MPKTKEIIWDVNNVEIGIPVVWEVQFSSTSSFASILYTLNTYDPVTASPIGVFFYSIDDANTWVNYPLGSSGMAFYAPYKMKIVVNLANVSNVYAEKYGKIYRLAGDCSSIIDTYDIGSFNSTGFENDSKDNLFVSGQSNTFYKIESSTTLKPGNSLNIRSNPVGLTIDYSRNSFWQIDKGHVQLKDLQGNIKVRVNLPFDC